MSDFPIVISPEDQQRFLALRRDLFTAIGEALEEDGHCKSYEGTFEIAYGFPNYFDDGEADGWAITLHCYVVGPSRHYEWTGRTFTEALDKCEVEVRAWIARRSDRRRQS